MTLINLRALGITLGTPLFSGLDLTLGKGDRVGLVAANGRGKSSLLRAISGQADFTSGELTTARGLRIGFLEQDAPDDFASLSVHDIVSGGLDPEAADYESWRADIALDDLNIPIDLHHAPFASLSGGWRRLVMLARVAVTEPDVILMDEPTNHLDLMRIGFLESWIASRPRDIAMIVASHDRAFLDTVTTRTLFLRPDESRDFALPFTPARVALDEADEAAGRQFDNQMKKAAQLRRQAAKLNNIGINSGSDLLTKKTKQLRDRAQKVEAAARPAHREQSAGAIRLSNSGTHAKALLGLEHAKIVTPDGRPLFETGQIWINRGDRVVLLGTNGAGKTQLMTRVAAVLSGGEDEAIRATPSVVAGISDQELSQIDESLTPMQVITGQFDVGDARARAALAGAGMDVRLQDSKVSALSGGQKARLAMLVLRLSQPNFYLLDEPTNHLDIEGQEALESEIVDREATCLIVSHDRSFVRSVGTRFWQIIRRRLVEVDSPEQFFAEALEPEE